MSEKNGSIYHLESYIQIQKLTFISKICFFNDKLNPRVEKIKTIHATESKWGTRTCFQARIFTVFKHREGKRIHVLKIL